MRMPLMKSMRCCTAGALGLLLSMQSGALWASRGHELYQANCAMCHGAEGKAVGGIPDLRRSKLPKAEFVKVVREGRQGTIMPAMGGSLSDAEILAIRAYVTSVAE